MHPPTTRFSSGIPTRTRRVRSLGIRRLCVLMLTLVGLVAGSLGATALGSGTASAAPYGSGHGLCFDVNSPLARTSLTKIGRDSNGGTWSPYRASTNPVSGGCFLDWMLVNGNGIGDGTYESRVLLFQHGRFLGTVDPKPYPFTFIARSTKYSVTVRYRWLLDRDPLCCASGGPTEVTAFGFAGRIFRIGTFPPHS